jgi:hypothetical protein
MTEQEFMKKVKKVCRIFGEKFRRGEYPDKDDPIRILNICVGLPNKKAFIIDGFTFATERFLSTPIAARHSLVVNMSQEDADKCVYRPTNSQMYDARQDIVNALIAEGIPADSITIDCAYDD